MSKAKRGKPIYQRGPLRLDRRPDRENLEITWYDPAAGRERSASAGTADVERAIRKTDEKYWEVINKLGCCPTCGRAYESAEDKGEAHVADLIEAYLVSVKSRSSYEAIANRMAHVVRFIKFKNPNMTHLALTPQMIEEFRAWNLAQPIRSKSGKERPRAHSTVENSVLQLAAALRHGKVDPQFKVIQPKEVNETPQYRADIATIAKAFDYCLRAEDLPKSKKPRSDKERHRQIRAREQLLRFLRLSIVTLARPDAAHDVSTAPARRQWNSERSILALNPAGRRQTKKYRAVVPIARQFAPHLDDCTGPYVSVESVKSAHEAMALALNLPGDGESGMKLWRRSMANLLRERMPTEAWGEISIFMGHDQFDDTTDLYAPFRPDYLRRALAEIEAVVDEIEKLAPGAFYRTDTAEGGNVFSIRSAKSA